MFSWAKDQRRAPVLVCGSTLKRLRTRLQRVASGELDFPIYVVTIHSEGSKNIGKDKLGYSAIGAVSNPTFLIGSRERVPGHCSR